MDTEDYSQFTLNADDLGDQVGYLAEDMEGIKSLIATPLVGANGKICGDLGFGQ